MILPPGSAHRLVIISDSWGTTSPPLPICREPMGVESGLLYDQQITSSSFYDANLAPHRGRLNGENSWTAKITDQNQYLEVGL